MISCGPWPSFSRRRNRPDRSPPPNAPSPLPPHNRNIRGRNAKMRIACQLEQTPKRLNRFFGRAALLPDAARCDSPCLLGRGPAGMGKPYADDLRKVAVRLIEEDHTRPEVADLCQRQPQHGRPLHSAVSHHRQRQPRQVRRLQALCTGEVCCSDQAVDCQATGPDLAGAAGPPSPRPT